MHIPRLGVYRSGRTILRIKRSPWSEDCLHRCVVVFEYEAPAHMTLTTIRIPPRNGGRWSLILINEKGEGGQPRVA